MDNMLTWVIQLIEHPPVIIFAKRSVIEKLRISRSLKLQKPRKYRFKFDV